MKIGGNTLAVIQVRTMTEKNVIGEAVQKWEDVIRIKGFLDLVTGEAKHGTYNTKIEESTHIFLCDYHSLAVIGANWLCDETDFQYSFINEESVTMIPIVSENARIVINGGVYDVTMIDDPMGLHEHLEIYLRKVGALNE